jgi:anti-anti-sigma regulatory factor
MSTMSPPRWPPATVLVPAEAASTIRVATTIVVGAGDRIAAGHLARYLDAVIGVGARDLIVDVSAVDECDGRLLTVLARARAELLDRGGVLEVTGVSLPHFLDALQDAGPDEAFVVYDALRGRSRARGAVDRAPAHELAEDGCASAGQACT